MKNRIIDMSIYRSPNSKVYSGRNEGYNLRDKLQLENEDELEGNIVIQFPIDTYSINSGFFLGLFGNSIRKLGKERFLKKYTFIVKDVLLKNIEKDISRALKINFLL